MRTTLELPWYAEAGVNWLSDEVRSRFLGNSKWTHVKYITKHPQ